MTPKEQEILFTRTRGKFPVWSASQVSGYVHGVNDGMREITPARQWDEDNMDATAKYARGYCYGYVDACGSDVLLARWGKETGIDLIDADYRWWLKETD